MQWKLIHEDLDVLDNSEIVSRTLIIFQHEGIEIKIGDSGCVEKHTLGAKRALVDTAYKLQDMARQMLKKADSLQ